MDSVEDWSHRPEPDQLFYFSGGRGDSNCPRTCGTWTQGFMKCSARRLSYHAMVEVVDGRRYVLLQRPERFRRARARAVCRGAGGLRAQPGAGGFLGWVLARKVMAPVVRLARQVRHRDQLLGLAPPLGAGLRRR